MYAHVWIVVARATDCCSSFSLRALAESLAPAPARVCGCGARGHLHIMRVGGACPYSSPPTALCGSVVTKRSALNNARETRLLQHFHFTQCRLQRKLHSAHKRHKAAAESTPEKPPPRVRHRTVAARSAEREALGANAVGGGEAKRRYPSFCLRVLADRCRLHTGVQAATRSHSALPNFSEAHYVGHAERHDLGPSIAVHRGGIGGARDECRSASPRQPGALHGASQPTRQSERRVSLSARFWPSSEQLRADSLGRGCQGCPT